MENIQVATRLKPDDETVWGIHPPHHLYSLQKRNSTQRTTFTFDNCYGPEHTNADVYTQSVKNIVMNSLKGINGTIFLYGQTGSGKTYTMLGAKNDGILIQSLKDLFDEVQNDLDKSFVVRCSYIEIYNEQIYDLLKPPSRLAEVLTVAEDSNKEFYVRGVIEESVLNINEILEVLSRGEKNRHYAQTSMNHHSSRSHTIFRLTIQSVTNNFIRNYRREQSQLKFQTLQEKPDELESQQIQQNTQSTGALIMESVLNFVDLAGSEKVSNHTSVIDEQSLTESYDGKIKERVKEGQYINKSLFFLTQVIYLKAEDKGHIPYRNSSLTKILRSSLGGNSRTLIILCLNPAACQYEYTMSTIRFGMNAKKIENKIKANIRNQNDDEAMKILISEYEKKIRDLEKAKLEDKESIELLQQETDQKRVIIDDLERRISSLNRKLFNQQPQIIEVAKKKKPRLVREIEKLKSFFTTHISNIGDVAIARKQLKVKLMKKLEHDCGGKLAIGALKIWKGRCLDLEFQMNQLISNYQNIKEDYLNAQHYLNFYKQKLSCITEEYEKSLTNCRNLFKLSEEMSNKLDLHNLTSFSQQILNDTKQFYQINLKKLEQEEWRRTLMAQLESNQQRSADSLHHRKDRLLNEDKLQDAFSKLQSLLSQTNFGENIKQIGQSLCSKMNYGESMSMSNSQKRERANQLDVVFFKGFKEELLNLTSLITLEQLQLNISEEIVEKEVTKESSSEEELEEEEMKIHQNDIAEDEQEDKNNGIEFSYHQKSDTNPMLGRRFFFFKQFLDGESQCYSQNQQYTGNIGNIGDYFEDHSILKQQFQQALINFISEVDKDKINNFIQENDISQDKSSSSKNSQNLQVKAVNEPVMKESRSQFKTPENVKSTNYYTKTGLVAKSTTNIRNRYQQNNHSQKSADKYESQSQRQGSQNSSKQRGSMIPKGKVKHMKTNPDEQQFNTCALVQQQEDYTKKSTPLMVSNSPTKKRRGMN